jgi:hypothetical protein
VCHRVKIRDCGAQTDCVIKGFSSERGVYACDMDWLGCSLSVNAFLDRLLIAQSDGASWHYEEESHHDEVDR